ncbi:MAG TPA: carboxypeptidase-like regulatory domain-containing protein, partial [Gemmatimonadaceae bacterium]|nr:carboxypeptidase-like regulatory domain-containing protein [Gemmatimonadaceae bacterium]
MPYRNLRWLAAFGALALIAHATPAAAAGVELPPPTPDVRGVVQDTAGHPLPNVQVVIRALSRTARTDAEGRFLFRGLPAGSYHLDAIHVGYVRASV